MTDILIAELALPAYAGLSDADAAARLAEPVEGSAGPLDLDWLDSLLIAQDLWPVMEHAAVGTLPEGAAGQAAATQTAATTAARMLVETLRSARRHPHIDTSQGQFAQGVAALVACSVVPAATASAVAAKARLTRMQQLGIGQVTEADVGLARLAIAEQEQRRG